MDTIVRQAVEVGATEVLPLLTSRVVVRLNEEKRRARGDRWRRIAKSAAEQSRRSQVAVVHDPMPLRDALAMLDEYDAVVVVWEKAPSTAGLWDAIAAFGLHAGSRLALVIGPEGGLSDEEVAALAAVGGVPVTLGAGILRTETAAVVALALCQHALVELGVTGE
jgi:16S rRNA (uracil1498-N3)-methyltransferase